MSYSLAVTRLLHSAERPFEDAIAMPPDVYTNRDFLDRELRIVPHRVV